MLVNRILIMRSNYFVENVRRIWDHILSSLVPSVEISIIRSVIPERESSAISVDSNNYYI